MSRIGSAGDVQRGIRPEYPAVVVAEIPVHRKGGDWRSSLLYVQLVSQGGLEDVQEVLFWNRRLR